MISQTVEYALRAVVTIAQHDGRPSASKVISAATQVPGPYFSKLMQGLVRGGQLFCRSFRGFVDYDLPLGGREGLFAAVVVMALPLLALAAAGRLLPLSERD